MSEYSGVLIYGEVLGGKLTTMTGELVSLGKQLAASLGQPVYALLITDDSGEAAGEIVALGADKVYVVVGASFYSTSPDLYTDIITEICKQTTPAVVLMGQTDMGKEVGPRLAARLGASVVTDCVRVEVDAKAKKLVQTKPVYGGNALAVWETDLDKPCIATLRPRSTTPVEPDYSRHGEIINYDFDAGKAAIKAKLIEAVIEENQEISLEEAKVVVAGGGGIGGRDGFTLLENLCRILGGAIGVTRVPCDEKWMPLRLEIGQTGHIIGPDLYIAVGISGAPQHMAGCSSAKYIVAINRDPDAYIFREADFGVVGDYQEALPSMLEALKN